MFGWRRRILGKFAGPSEPTQPPDLGELLEAALGAAARFGPRCDYVTDVFYAVASYDADKPVSRIVSAVLPDAVVQRTFAQSVDEALAEIRAAVLYTGQGTESDAATDPAWLAAWAMFEQRFHHLTDRASCFAGFSLRSGHPYYPVFWDFAYVIRDEDAETGSAHVLLASSSD